MPRRQALRQLRQRANALAGESYAAYLATLIEIYEAHGLDAALGYEPSIEAGESRSL